MLCVRKDDPSAELRVTTNHKILKRSYSSFIGGVVETESSPHLQQYSKTLRPKNSQRISFYQDERPQRPAALTNEGSYSLRPKTSSRFK